MPSLSSPFETSEDARGRFPWFDSPRLGPRERCISPPRDGEGIRCHWAVASHVETPVCRVLTPEPAFNWSAAPGLRRTHQVCAQSAPATPACGLLLPCVSTGGDHFMTRCFRRAQGQCTCAMYVLRVCNAVSPQRTLHHRFPASRCPLLQSRRRLRSPRLLPARRAHPPRTTPLGRLSLPPTPRRRPRPRPPRPLRALGPRPCRPLSRHPGLTGHRRLSLRRSQHTRPRRASGSRATANSLRATARCSRCPRTICSQRGGSISPFGPS